MPNYCDNRLYISHPDIKMMRRVVKGWNRGRLLSEFIPVPPELSDNAMSIERIMRESKQKRNSEYAQELDKFREELNKKYFGYADWYAFCVAEWGTKWDVGREGDFQPLLTPDSARRELCLSFSSAWSPPIGAYEKLHAMGFDIRAYYYEGGYAFCGKWENGSDECYNIDGNSEWVIESIPEDIDQEMNISECMAEWEEENA